MSQPMSDWTSSSSKDPRAIITGDYDGDGATDLLITQNHGPAVLLRNEGGNKNNWLKLDLQGLADNKSAIGTKIEIFSGANRQKFELAGSSGYLGQNSLQLNIGLGQAKQADVVRMLWPTGVLQDEIEVPANKVQSYTEMDRRGSSCPTLFVWDGDHYELVADMIGAGVVGHWVAPGERNIARPTEYIKLNRDTVHEKDGKLSFRLMEPMEEVVYLDKVGLMAVDHPANFDVYPNEYFASNPPYPSFKVVASGNAQPPAAVHDDHGHNLLPDLLAHRYVGDFELAPFKGFTKLHSIELDLGKPYSSGPLWLLLDGEIEYFTATGMYAADQAGIKAIAPYVEALGANGKWTRVIDDMGFPAGGPRTMTADLTGKLPVRDAAHTHLDKLADLLEQHFDRPHAAVADHTPHPDTTAHCQPRFPRLSAANRSAAAGSCEIRLRASQPHWSLRTPGRNLHSLRRCTPAPHQLRRPPDDLRVRGRGGPGIRSIAPALTTIWLEARLFLCRKRIRKGHGFLRRSR